MRRKTKKKIKIWKITVGNKTPPRPSQRQKVSPLLTNRITYTSSIIMNGIAIAITTFLCLPCTAVFSVPLPAFWSTTTDNETAPSCGRPAIEPDLRVRIVGGEDAVPYSWPWQVALMVTDPWFGGSYQFCAGTVIADQWVMTAGHCFYGETSVKNYAVLMGVYDKTSDHEPGEQSLGISEIHVHPKFDPKSTHFDITLLKLVTPVNFTDHISPVCLPSLQDEDVPEEGTAVYVTGWGSTAEWGQDSATLKQVVVPIANISVCKDRYEEIGARVYEDTMFCAGLEEGGKDSCQGDSGGPVVYKDPVTGAWKQIGITSWGRGCAEAKYFGVYSKVAAYVDFIREYVDL